MNAKTIYMAANAEIGQAESSGIIDIANISLDLDSRQAMINDVEINFTAMEFDLFSYLVVNRNRAVSRHELLKEIWGFENIVETRATDDMIKRLRKKLKYAGSELKIATVWGYGFKTEAPRHSL